MSSRQARLSAGEGGVKCNILFQLYQTFINYQFENLNEFRIFMMIEDRGFIFYRSRTPETEKGGVKLPLLHPYTSGFTAQLSIIWLLEENP